MKKKITKISISVILVSVFVLVWVNTDGPVVPGYNACGRGGFIPSGFGPKSSITSGPGVYNGICFGEPTTKRVSGRYSNAHLLNQIFGTTITLGLISLLFVNRPSQKKR